MAANMETLGIGGHELFAEKIFEKIKDLPSGVQMVELTKQEYDALTPEQKADPTKLYVVPGDGSYLKFREISSADYDALTDEEKMDPTTVYLTPGTGTYFQVIDISQEDYDALSEEEKTDPQKLYLIPGDDNYLTKEEADEIYLSQEDAAETYLSSSDAATTYATKSELPDMSSYETSSHASSTYLSKAEAESTYVAVDMLTVRPGGTFGADFNDPIGGTPLNKCVARFSPIQIGSGTPSPNNIRKIYNWRDCMVEQYRETGSVVNTYNVTIDRGDGIVYTGTFDFLTGDVTLTQFCKIFDGTETITLKEWLPDHQITFSYTFDDETFEYKTYDGGNGLCSHYNLNGALLDTDYSIFVYEPEGASRTNIQWRHDSITSVSDMQTYLSDQYNNGRPLQVLMELEEPIVYQITNLPTIRTLKGGNRLRGRCDHTNGSSHTTKDVPLSVEYATEHSVGLIHQIMNLIQ